MKRIFSLVFALTLSACGGGSSSSSPTGLSVSFSMSSLAFSYVEGGAIRSQTIQASVSGKTDKDILIGAEVSGTGITTPIEVAVNEKAGTAAITVFPQGGLPAGTYSGTIKLLACADAYCKVHHGGSPFSVPYTVTVSPGLKLAVSGVSIGAAQTGSATSSVDYRVPAGAAISTSITYAGGQTDWLSAQVAGNAVQLQASAGHMPLGTYQATLTVSAPSINQSATIPVKFTVATGLVVPDSASLNVDSSTTAQQMQGQVPVAMAAGATAQTWTASSDQPWLKLAQTSGTFPATATWSIDQAAFSALANNARYKANIRFATDNSQLERTYVLDVYKALAEIKSLDSVALLAGQSGDVMLYGAGFDRLPSGSNAIAVAGIQPSAVSILSDKVIRVSLPGMSAGTYNVALKHASDATTPTKAIRVNGSESFSYQVFDTEGQKLTMVWDSVSKSAFVLNATMKSVMRYAAVNGTFQLAATRSFAGVDSIAMTPDRTALVLQSNYYTIYKLSPTDLSTQKMFVLSSGSSPSQTGVSLPITGDNRLMHPSRGWIDLDTGAASPLVIDPASQFYADYHADWAAVSGNGLRVMRPDSGRVTPHSPIFHLDLVSGKFVAYPHNESPFFYRYAVDYAGNSWAFNNQVVDFGLNLKGSFKLPTGWSGNEQVFSRNGSRLYIYAQKASSTEKPRVYAFDTSQTLTTTTEFPIVGYVEVADLPNCPYNPNGGYNDQCYTFNTKIAISDDDQTMFIAGDKKFIVLPIPSNLRATPQVQLAPLVKIRL